MAKLISLNNVNDTDLISKLFDNNLMIYEDVEASKLFINWDGSKFIYRAKSINAPALSIIDLVTQKYYGDAFYHFENISDDIKNILRTDYHFCVEYFPDEQPSNIKYDYVPKNKMILTHIIKDIQGKKIYEINLDEIREFARIFNIDILPVIHYGKLTPEQKTKILNFLKTNPEDLEYIYDGLNFSEFFYKILNPDLDSSILMRNNNFQDNVHKFIIKVIGIHKLEDLTFEILNPLYKRQSEMIPEDEKTKYQEVYEMLLLVFLNFLVNYNFDRFSIDKSVPSEKRYVDIMCILFNDFILNNSEEFDSFEFSVPEFFNSEKFKVNTELLDNEITKSYIMNNSKYEYLLKIVISGYRKRKGKGKPSLLFNEFNIVNFNNMVDKINNMIS